MAVQVSKRLINVSEYNRMAEAGILTENDRVELIHGEIIEMSPIGSKHAAAVNRLSDLLKEHLGRRAIVSVQNPVAVNDWNEPEPDIAILKYADDYYENNHPAPGDILLIIEVADTTKVYDREIKIPLYARAGIPECWLVDLNTFKMEVYKAPSSEGYKKIEIIGPDDAVGLEAFGIVLEARKFLTRKS